MYVLCTSSYNSLNLKSDQLISPYSKTTESSINPLTPKSDSPINITPKTNRGDIENRGETNIHENKGNDHKLKELLIVKQILFVSTTGNA